MPALPRLPDARPTRPDRLAARVRSIPSTGIRRFFDLIQTMDDVISLGVGEPDFITPWHIREAAIYSLERGVTSYTSNYGLIDLRRQLADHLVGRYGVEYDPLDEILITVGVSEGLDIAMRAIIDPGDEVVVPDPGYVSYAPCVTLAGAVVRPVPTRASERFWPRPAEVADRLSPSTKAVLMTGWRVGYIAAPREIMAGLVKIHQYTALCAPVTSQVAASKALRHGETDVVGMVEEYDRRRRVMVKGLHAAGLACLEPEGAFYAFPSVESVGQSDEDFAERLLLEERVAVVPGSAFGECGRGHVRCCYATSLSQIEEALRRISSYASRHSIS